MALNLIRRLIKGAPLTAQDHDANLDVIEAAIEQASQSAGEPGPAADTLAWSTGGKERARIDSSGRLLVGTSSAPSASTSAILQMVGANDGAILIIGNPATTIGPNGFLGGVSFLSNDESTWGAGAQILCLADVAHTSTNKRSRLVFSTTADGAATPTEQLRITSDRYVRLASGTGGIQFNGDTAAANALDDYEEGTFTPTIIGTTVAGTGTYIINVGSYTKIGNRVLFSIRVTWTAHTGTGDMQISGLPFTVASSVSVSIRHTDLTSPAGTIVQVHAPNATQVVRLDSVATGGGASTPLAIDTAGDIMISGVYVA